MTSLHRWFLSEYARLEEAGKGRLAAAFEDMRAAVFQPDPGRALAALPELRRLADRLREPTWRAAVDYYDGAVAIGWCGDLVRGMAALTAGLASAAHAPDRGSVLSLFLQEALLGAWLSVDSPGYAPAVRDAASAALAASPPEDIQARMTVVCALAEAAIDPTQAPRSRQHIESALLALDWPEPYRLRMQGAALILDGRPADGCAVLLEAAAGLDALGCAIDSDEARLQAAAGYLGWQPETALDLACGMLPRTVRSINRAHDGTAHGLVGQALLACGAPAQAIPWLGSALKRLAGLGWARLEAELALAVAGATALASPADLPEALQAARERIDGLRSKDLVPALLILSEGQGDAG